MSLPSSLPPAEQDLQATYAHLRASWQQERVPTLSQRRDWLNRLERLLLDNKGSIVEAVSRDFGHRSEVETQLAELFPALQGIRHARRHLAGWMRPQRRRVSLWFQPARTWVMPQPLGVVGIVVPWNYPIFVAIGPLVAALAAGNRVMIKMSEYTPATGALLATLLERYLGPDRVAVVNGEAALAQAFTRLPFDHLLFTGSTAVGRQVMHAAAENLTPVTLELGGKSPAIVAPGADISRAAVSIVAGKLLNAGQTCVAPDYVLVAENQIDALTQALRAAASRAYPTLAENPDYTAIINARHRGRLHAWLQEAVAAGATAIEINPAQENLEPTGKMALTLVLGCPDSATLLQEEIFGPILPLVTYREFDDALAYVNARPRPLALYLFDTQPARIRRTLAETISGGVAINDTLLQVAQDDLPFGGVGPSGMGHYHAYEGFLTFSKLKPVFEQSRFSGVWLTRPPYGARVAWMLKWMLGR